MLVVKIDLTELLREVGNEAEIEVALEGEAVTDPEDNLVLSQPIKGSLHLINADASVLVLGKLTTQAVVECSRCLKKIDLPLAVNLKEEFSRNDPFQRHKRGGDRELHESDFVYPIEPDNSIDLSEVIRENLLLALPIKKLCQPDCQGIK